MDIDKVRAGFFYHTETLKIYCRPQSDSGWLPAQVTFELNFPESKTTMEERSRGIEEIPTTIKDRILPELNNRIDILKRAEKKVANDLVGFYCRMTTGASYKELNTDDLVRFDEGGCPFAGKRTGLSLFKLGVSIYAPPCTPIIQNKFSITYPGHSAKWAEISPYVEWYVNAVLMEIKQYLRDYTHLYNELESCAKTYSTLVSQWNDRQYVQAIYADLQNLGDGYKFTADQSDNHREMMQKFVSIMDGAIGSVVAQHPDWFTSNP